MFAIAISGGIDSMMAAFVLKQSGQRVVGIHFITGHEIGPGAEDPAEDDADGSMAGLQRIKAQAQKKIDHIASQLDIDIELLDCRREFQQTVVDYFLQTYQAGRTPNPCMVCNPSIKFGTLLDFARQLGANRLATGHYARIHQDGIGRLHLLKGVDTAKDQSYFLARLTPEQLAQAGFPLGGMTKASVVKMAAAHGLTPATPSESQDVCFIKGRTYAQFLADQPGFRAQAGLIEDTRGKVIGQHQGLHLFTIGQRRGINCPAAEPYYVVALDPPGNRLIVGSKTDLLAAACRVDNINWISSTPTTPLDIQTRVRYRHQAAASRLFPLDAHTAEVRFETPQAALTPGQCAVFYAGDEVLGGGWIAASA